MFDHDITIGLQAGEFLEEPTADELWDFTVAAEADRPDLRRLPSGLEDLEPGILSAAIVSNVDREQLNGHDLIRLLKTEARLTSHYDAGRLATMAEVAMCPPGGPDSPVERNIEHMEYVADEVAAALNLTRRAAESELSLALRLRHRLVSVWERMRAGRLDRRRAAMFDDAIGHLGQESVDTIVESILDHSTHLTTGQLRARLARLALEVDPAGVDAGHEEGLAERRVVTMANSDHTATISACSILATDAVAINRRVNGFAQSLARNGDARTIDQIRADVFVDLMLGRTKTTDVPTGGGVGLQVRLSTLARLDDQPGELAGYGPVLADIARQTALRQAKDRWTFVVRDDDGRVIHTGVTRRRPKIQTRRDVEGEYPICVFPGCRMPAHDCDLDHRRPFSWGGPTRPENLGPLCRHHHMARHHAPWQLTRLPNGDHRWISPLEHTYISGRDPPW